MKRLYSIVLAFVFVLLFSSVCSATIYDEVEPNDTAAQALLIERNNHDPAQFINGNNDSQKVAVGSLSSTADQDWYKVNLPADANTVLSINSTPLSDTGYFDIYDANMTLVRTILHHKDPAVVAATPYYVNIPAAGLYYVRVSSSISSGEYRFTIGGPNYDVNSYYYTAPRACTLTTTISSVQDNYDLRNITSIPNNAIVYGLSIQGTKVNYASSEARSIKLQSDTTWITTATYSWNANVPVSSNKLVRSIWTFKLDGRVSNPSRPYSLTPRIRFSYVYAVLPQ